MGRSDEGSGSGVTGGGSDAGAPPIPVGFAGDGSSPMPSSMPSPPGPEASVPSGMLPGAGPLGSLIGGSVVGLAPLPAEPGDGAKPGMSEPEPSLDVPQAAASRARSEMVAGSSNERAREDDVMKSNFLSRATRKRCHNNGGWYGSLQRHVPLRPRFARSAVREQRGSNDVVELGRHSFRFAPSSLHMGTARECSRMATTSVVSTRSWRRTPRGPGGGRYPAVHPPRA